MPVPSIYLLVVPGFADWEPAHAIAELEGLSESDRGAWLDLFRSGRLPPETA